MKMKRKMKSKSKDTLLLVYLIECEVNSSGRHSSVLYLHYNLIVSISC